MFGRTTCSKWLKGQIPTDYYIKHASYEVKVKRSSPASEKSPLQTRKL